MRRIQRLKNGFRYSPPNTEIALKNWISYKTSKLVFRKGDPLRCAGQLHHYQSRFTFLAQTCTVYTYTN